MSNSSKGATAAKGGADAGADGAPAGGRRKRLVLLLGAVLLLAGGATAWFLLLGPGASAEAAEPKAEEVELGDVVTVGPISINLAGGHYLKLGLGLQTVAEVAHAPDGSLALDAAISLYSGRSMEELTDPTAREALKEELRHTLEEEYHHDVVDVYFTEYVMQ
jgi:flagellar FliL protein